MRPLATSLSPLSSSAHESSCVTGRNAGTPEVRVGRASRLPRGFRPIRGTPTNVRFGGHVPHMPGRTAAQKLGIAYETRVHDVLSAIYGDAYCVHPAILYTDRTGLRRAIPDGILRIGSTFTVIEVKLSHTELAWWQLTRLYMPLLSRIAAANSTIRGVELCRSYDPSVGFPEPHTIISSLHRLPSRGIGVLQWKI